MKTCGLEVNNLPENLHNYIVVRIDDSNLTAWYWGCWDDQDTAVEVAQEIGGIVVRKENLA